MRRPSPIPRWIPKWKTNSDYVRFRKRSSGLHASNFDGPRQSSPIAPTTNPNHTTAAPSYSIKVRVTAVYKHSLFLPLVNLVVDGIDGTSDGKLKGVVTEEMRVENPRLTTAGGLATCP